MARAMMIGRDIFLILKIHQVPHYLRLLKMMFMLVYLFAHVQENLSAIIKRLRVKANATNVKILILSRNAERPSSPPQVLLNATEFASPNSEIRKENIIHLKKRRESA